MPHDESPLETWQIIWLFQEPTSTVSRWLREAQVTNRKLTWQDAKSIAEAHKHSLLDPSWLSLSPSDPLPESWRPLFRHGEAHSGGDIAEDTNPGDQTDSDEVTHLTALIETLRADLANAQADLADARANLDNVDLAAMSYRDAWRRDIDRAERHRGSPHQPK